jgi:hypothetical protein
LSARDVTHRAVAPSRSAAWPLTGSLDPPKAADGILGAVITAYRGGAAY